MNEIANIAAAVGGIDVMDVVEGVTSDNRWRPQLPSGEVVHPGILSYLKPGCGFGGSCFPKDVKALRSMANTVGVQPRLLQAVLDVNAGQPQQVMRLLEQDCAELQNMNVLVLGLAFKPGTDDIRESVAFRVIEDLSERGVTITAHDPIALDNAREALAGNERVTLVTEWLPCLENVDAVIVTTLWEEYLALGEPAQLKQIHGKIFVDCRRGFNPRTFEDVKYLAIGYRPI